MSSVPREECVVSSHSHRAPSARGRPRLAGLKKHTGQAVNSTVRLSRSETKMSASGAATQGSFHALGSLEPLTAAVSTHDAATSSQRFHAHSETANTQRVGVWALTKSVAILGRMAHRRRLKSTPRSASHCPN